MLMNGRIFNPICLATHRLHVDIRGIGNLREPVVKLVPDCFRINCIKRYPTITESGSYNTHIKSGLVLLAWHIRPDVSIRLLHAISLSISVARKQTETSITAS